MCLLLMISLRAVMFWNRET